MATINFSILSPSAMQNHQYYTTVSKLFLWEQCSQKLLTGKHYIITGFQTVRLSGGSGPHEGQVNVFFNNTWRAICGDAWGKTDADVLCSQLGYTESVSGSGTSNDKVNFLYFIGYIILMQNV